MNVHIEIDQDLLQSAIEILGAAQVRCEADACALARLDAPEAQALARQRLETARMAEKLMFFFARK